MTLIPLQEGFAPTHFAEDVGAEVPATITLKSVCL